MKPSFLIFLLCLLLGTLPVLAQSVVTVPESPALEILSTDPAAQDNVYRILVIGDALAGGLGAGLVRMAALEPGFEIVNRFQETSGIARPEVYDWAGNLPKIMEDKEFDAVVVLMGANDRQSIKSGDFRYVFNSPEWITAYKAQTDALLDILNKMKVKVFWLAIPPMGDALYDADMKAVADLQKQEVVAKGATYVDLRSAFLNPDGSYTDKGVDETGVVRKLRERDGVTFLRPGNNRFGQLLLAEINTNKDIKPPDATPPSAPALTVVAPTIPDTVPTFGQTTGDGSIAVFQPPKPQLAETPEAVAPGAPVQAVSRADIVPGSSAEKLFVQGTAEKAPAGRFDDFSFSEPTP